MAEHWEISPLKPSGHYMYRTVVTICTASLTFNNSTFCPHSVFMCFVWISEQTAIISQYNINWLVFVRETECVYCAVRTESSYIFQVSLVRNADSSVDIAIRVRAGFSENTQTSNSMKVRPVGATLFHADRQTDMTKLIVGFWEFCERAQRWHNPLPKIREVFRQWSDSVAGFDSRRLMQSPTVISLLRTRQSPRLTNCVL